MHSDLLLLSQQSTTVALTMFMTSLSLSLLLRAVETRNTKCTASSKQEDIKVKEEVNTRMRRIMTGQIYDGGPII